MDDEALVLAFESCTLPPGAFSHREHVRVAWLYITRSPHFEEAGFRFCTGLRRYVAALGKSDRYHATLTWAFLALVGERQHATGAATFAEFAQGNADLFASGHGPIGALYDRATLGSERARQVFVLPGPPLRGTI